MVLRNWLGAASIAAMALATMPAFAQTSGDVVMRRPLASSVGGQGIPGDGTPTPTPTPTPPTSSTEPGTSYDPGLETPVSDPGNAFGVATWVVGPWQGTGQCGQTSTYTRDVSCVVVGSSVSIPVISMADPKGGFQSASWAQDAGRAFVSDAVYDPTSSDVKTILAQFGGPGDGGGSVKRTTEPNQYCMDNGAGPPPANTYTGTKGGCEYHAEQDDPGQWTIDPNSSGTATCSANAYRQPTYSCYDSDGQSVDLAYCVENIRNGGTRNDYQINPVYGNYAGCVTGWVSYPTDNYCFTPTTNPGYTDPDTKDGPDHYAYYTVKCMRSDGTQLTGPDEAACTDQEPQGGWTVIGSCAHEYYPGSGSNHCNPGSNDQNLLGKIAQSKDTYASDGTSNFCNGLQPACCGVRIAGNYDENDGQYEVVATSTPPSVQTGYFFDEQNVRRDPSQEGVLSLWYGADSGSYQVKTGDGSTPIDPNGVLRYGGSGSGGLGGLPPIN